MIIVNGKVCRNMQEQVKKNKDDIEDITALDISQRIVDEVTNQVDPLRTEVGQLEQLIPEEASSDNQLADKNFVNSSIASNTANFRGTYDSEEELPLTGNTPNDYAFVVTTDNEGNTVYKRFKWVDDEWLFEYDLNNSSFTAQQWANINMDHSKFLEKTNQIYKIYGTDNLGNQFNYAVSSYPTNNAIAQRTYDGRIKASTPTEDNDATTKKYVDDLVSGLASESYVDDAVSGYDSRISTVESSLNNKLDKSTATSKLYGTDYLGNQTMWQLASSSTANSIAVRQGNGALAVTTPVKNDDAANKKYVDDLVGTITGTKSTFKATKTDILTLLNTDALPLNKWISVDSGKITFQTRTSSTSEQTGGTIQDSYVYRTLYGGCMFKILLYSSSNNTFNIQYIEGTSSDSDPASTRQTITPVAYQYAYQRNQSSAINLLGKITVLE